MCPISQKQSLNPSMEAGAPAPPEVFEAGGDGAAAEASRRSE